MNREYEHEQGSDEHRQDLRIENEILKMKMLAETGAEVKGMNNLPPEIENAFLLQVLQFEEAMRKAKRISIYQLIGEPAYKKEIELNDEEIGHELNRLMLLLRKHNILFSGLAHARPRALYRLITEELFQMETEDIELPGMKRSFSYHGSVEDAKREIQEKAGKFLQGWFGMQIKGLADTVSDFLILDDGNLLSRQEAAGRIQNLFNSYKAFSNSMYSVVEVSVQWDEELRGFGFVEGRLHYEAEQEDGLVERWEGPYKLYFANAFGEWEIFFFLMPGFTW